MQALRGIDQRPEQAAVPRDHRPRAVVARRDHRLEVDVLERMVLDLHREPLVVGIHRRLLRAPPTSTGRHRSRAGGPSASASRRAGARRTSAAHAPRCRRGVLAIGSGVAPPVALGTVGVETRSSLGSLTTARYNLFHARSLHRYGHDLVRPGLDPDQALHDERVVGRHPLQHAARRRRRRGSSSSTSAPSATRSSTASTR